MPDFSADAADFSAGLVDFSADPADFFGWGPLALGGDHSVTYPILGR